LLRRWKAQVAETALAVWPAGQLPFTAELELRVTQYSERREIDRDNLVKPIQDALQGICYGNDRQIKDSMSNWRRIDGKFGIRYISENLAIAFSRGAPFLHIRLFMSPDAEDLG
jgi:Holliday junction resolvase RusA-like endonuclease